MNVKKLEVQCAIVLLIAFFLPWVSFGGIINVSGYNLTRAVDALESLAGMAQSLGADGAQAELPAKIKLLYLVYLVPVAAAAVLYLDFNGKSTKIASLIGGALPVLGFAYGFVESGVEMFDFLAIGAVLTGLAGVGLLVAGIRAPAASPTTGT